MQVQRRFAISKCFYLFLFIYYKVSYTNNAQHKQRGVDVVDVRFFMIKNSSYAVLYYLLTQLSTCRQQLCIHCKTSRRQIREWSLCLAIQPSMPGDWGTSAPSQRNRFFPDIWRARSTTGFMLWQSTVNVKGFTTAIIGWASLHIQTSFPRSPSAIATSSRLPSQNG